MPGSATQKRTIPHVKNTAVPTAAKKGGLRNDLKRFTREKLIAAAISSFQELGFKETTVERIVELAGTTAPTFYRHFGSKDQLLVPLQQYLSEKVMDCLAKISKDDIRSPTAFERWICEYIDMWEDVHRLCKAFWDASSLDTGMDRSTFLTMFETSDTIDRLIPGLPKPEKERQKLRLGLLLLMLDRLAFLTSLAPDKRLRKMLIAEYADIMWTTIFSPR